MKATVLLTILGLIPIISLAEGWSGPFTVENISIEGTDGQPIAYINFVPPDNSTPSQECSPLGFAGLKTNTLKGQQALAIAQVALAADKKVYAFFTSNCPDGRLRISHINLFK